MAFNGDLTMAKSKYTGRDEQVYQAFLDELDINVTASGMYRVVSWHLRGRLPLSTPQINRSLDKRVKAGELLKVTSCYCTCYTLPKYAEKEKNHKWQGKDTK